MALEPCSPASELLLHWGNRDTEALKEILPLAYDDLLRLARHYLRQSRPNHTLQTTGLVHEACLRLAEEKSLHVEDRAHFLGIAAQLMRWILLDYERNRRAAKRGAGATRLTLDPSIAQGPAQSTDLDPTIEDTSQFLGISPATVRRNWASAGAWLLREMSRGESRA